MVRIIDLAKTPHSVRVNGKVFYIDNNTNHNLYQKYEGRKTKSEFRMAFEMPECEYALFALRWS